MKVAKNNHFKKRTIVPRRPPTRTSGLAMSTVWKSMPLYCENSSMNAPNSKKQASAAEPMEYPYKERRKKIIMCQKVCQSKDLVFYCRDTKNISKQKQQKIIKKKILFTLVIAFVTFPAASRRSVASRTRSG